MKCVVFNTAHRYYIENPYQNTFTKNVFNAWKFNSVKEAENYRYSTSYAILDFEEITKNSSPE